MSSFCRYGKSLFFLGWHEIRETLYEGLPHGVVEFGRRFASYDDLGADGVVVKFKVLLHPFISGVHARASCLHHCPSMRRMGPPEMAELLKAH